MPPKSAELSAFGNSPLLPSGRVFKNADPPAPLPLISGSGGLGIDTLTKSNQQASNRDTFGYKILLKSFMMLLKEQ